MRNPHEVMSRYVRSAPVDIVPMIRDFGLRVRTNAQLPAKIAGHIKPAGKSYEIASSATDHPYRQRFTLAHELGHFLLHRDMIEDGIDDNTMYRSTEDGELYNDAIKVEHERQANSFAANLLMPEALVRKEINSAPGKYSLRALARKFEVSPSAMRWRLKNLELYERVRDD